MLPTTVPHHASDFTDLQERSVAITGTAAGVAHWKQLRPSPLRPGEGDSGAMSNLSLCHSSPFDLHKLE
ncbi:hypothetical protein SAMN04489733_7857 [Amycolatopsis keratiniphila]|nr:hypothetical protein SAMN04489733_7857 [Amycolatopsis keratiniphila]